MADDERPASEEQADAFEFDPSDSDRFDLESRNDMPADGQRGRR
ncbi:MULTISPECIES: hypothetical protein [Streptosporangium]|uniref:Uncharacterized protein n=1 Tax=Streptosporangium brasiliense TaxID=47480 RepID=A0ABT9R6M8_9ACTN|nr:hypothetical protein [Streptosporangium brasiliense]MDP9864897.1 hypothetical protein [Streptosporangium brasiliense]